MLETLQADLNEFKHFCGGRLQNRLYRYSVAEIDDAIEWLKVTRYDQRWSTKDVANRAIAAAAEVGEELGLTQQAVWNFENGKTKRVPAWMRFVRIAAASASLAAPGRAPPPLSPRANELLICFEQLSDVDQVALLQIATTMAGRNVVSTRLHTSKSDYRAQPGIASERGGE